MAAHGVHPSFSSVADQFMEAFYLGDTPTCTGLADSLMQQEGSVIDGVLKLALEVLKQPCQTVNESLSGLVTNLATLRRAMLSADEKAAKAAMCLQTSHEPVQEETDVLALCIVPCIVPCIVAREEKKVDGITVYRTKSPNYTGWTDANNTPHGEGVLVGEGFTYKGEFRKGALSGQGECTLKATVNGNEMIYSFKGQWKGTDAIKCTCSECLKEFKDADIGLLHLHANLHAGDLSIALLFEVETQIAGGNALQASQLQIEMDTLREALEQEERTHTEVMQSFPEKDHPIEFDQEFDRHRQAIKSLEESLKSLSREIYEQNEIFRQISAMDMSLS